MDISLDKIYIFTAGYKLKHERYIYLLLPEPSFFRVELAKPANSKCMKKKRVFLKKPVFSKIVGFKEL